MRSATIAFALLLCAATAYGQQRPSAPPSITVNGEAILVAEPDQAQIDIGVTTQARTAPEAARENAERSARVLAEVKKLLGKGDEARTSGYGLNPQYRYPKDGKPEIIGYVANNVVRIRTARLEDVGRLIDAAMQAGANNIGRLLFTLKDEDGIRQEALKQAAAKARTKAEAMAAALGVKVVRVIALNEGERSFQPVLRQAQMMARAEAAAAPTPIEPGTVEVRSTVTLTVEIQ